jgi:hypothetical protein
MEREVDGLESSLDRFLWAGPLLLTIIPTVSLSEKQCRLTQIFMIVMLTYSYLFTTRTLCEREKTETFKYSDVI